MDKDMGKERRLTIKQKNKILNIMKMDKLYNGINMRIN